jgi:predicted SAM-dependent methyltransferase
MSASASQLATGALRRAGAAGNRAVWLARREAARRRFAGLAPGTKLHLGCGSNHFDGWFEVDLERKNRPDVVHDLRLGLPASSGTVRFIYSEHLFEHLPLDDAQYLMRDCAAVLQSGGIMRVAMPDLESLVAFYQGDWRTQPWIHEHGYDHMSSAAEMLNTALRDWGHQYIYDFTDLRQRLVAAGFTEVHRCEWGRSDVPELAGLETRDDSRLVVEAVAG